MRNVIIVGVHRGLNEVEPLDIKQMVGRSGRMGIDTRGDAYILLPKTKFMRYKTWCENIPVISSTMNNQDTLAFHIISEISEGEIFDVPTLMEWYNRSLAAFQNNFLDRVEAEELLTKLENLKVIERQKTVFKITNLGKVAAYLYLSPYSIAYWFTNFSKIFSENKLDEYSLSWALSNIPDNDSNFVDKDLKKEIEDFRKKCLSKNLFISNGSASTGFLYLSCLTFGGQVVDQKKKQVKYDFERVCTALEMIDKMYANWNKGVFWKKLQLRIEYEITEEQTELCELKGIGGVRARILFNEGIRTKEDFKRKKFLAKDIIGEDLYERICLENRESLNIK